MGYKMANLYCITCNAKKEEGRKDSYCRSCRSAKSRENKHKAYLAKGHVPRPKNSEGRSKNCRVCNEVKEPGYENGSYCKKCDSERKKKAREIKSCSHDSKILEKPINNSCFTCGSEKESPRESYCVSCRRKKEREGRVRRGVTKKHRTGLCRCGAEFDTSSKDYCLKCRREVQKLYYETHKPTEEQQVRKNEQAKARRAAAKALKPPKPKKEKLDPSLWVKPKKTKKPGTKVDGVYVLCSRPNCDNTEGILSNGWCKPCAAAYQRERLKYYHLAEKSPEQQLRHRVRALTRAYIKHGKLIKGPCEICNTIELVEAHHDDYTKPMDIRWLCKKHHRQHHRNEKLLTEDK